jgi:hypothetical protein
MGGTAKSVPSPYLSESPNVTTASWFEVKCVCLHEALVVAEDGAHPSWAGIHDAQISRGDALVHPFVSATRSVSVKWNHAAPTNSAVIPAKAGTQ